MVGWIFDIRPLFVFQLDGRNDQNFKFFTSRWSEDYFVELILI